MKTKKDKRNEAISIILVVIVCIFLIMMLSFGVIVEQVVQDAKKEITKASQLRGENIK